MLLTLPRVQGLPAATASAMSATTAIAHGSLPTRGTLQARKAATPLLAYGVLHRRLMARSDGRKHLLVVMFCACERLSTFKAELYLYLLDLIGCMFTLVFLRAVHLDLAATDMRFQSGQIYEGCAAFV